jgi:hypothetical protein
MGKGRLEVILLKNSILGQAYGFLREADLVVVLSLAVKRWPITVEG